MKKLLSLLLLICTALSTTSCAKTRSRVISAGGEFFDTAASISTYKDKSDKIIDSYVEISREVLLYYHRQFDIYHTYDGINNIKTINDNAGISPVKVDVELLSFLEYCKELYTITNGKTNIMLGSVLRLWHDARTLASKNYGFIDESKLPSAATLDEANAHTSIDLLVIDMEASTVYITDPQASIDVGAIAKGYTVDKLCERLKSEGADSTVINVGGNIRTIGLKPGGKMWQSGITNPDSSSDESLLCRINIGESSVVTSGDYERFFYAGDTVYHHIINPETLFPARYFSSVTILTESSALADALSTALFCMSYEDGLALVNSIGGVEVIWVDLEYNMTSTSGISFVD